MSSRFINQKPTLALTVLHPAPLQPFQTHPPPQISTKPIATRLSAYTESVSESEELEVASPPCSLSIQQQPSARDPMPEIEADIDVDDVDAPDVSSDVNLDMNPDVNTPSLYPWVPAPE